MTPEAARLAEIEARANAATEGPWTFEPRGWADKSATIRLGERDHDGFLHHAEANAEFIAHAREDVPWLLAALREASPDDAGEYTCSGAPYHLSACDGTCGSLDDEASPDVALIEALEEFGEHHESCPSLLRHVLSCTCGFRDALAAARTESEPAPEIAKVARLIGGPLKCLSYTFVSGEWPEGDTLYFYAEDTRGTLRIPAEHITDWPHGDIATYKLAGENGRYRYYRHESTRPHRAA